MTKEEAIERLKTDIYKYADFKENPNENEFWTAFDMAIKVLEQESLTDKEQRIFLAAMGREEKICREVDEKYPDKEPYEDSLVSVCRSIERKVKKALWK